MYNQSIETWQEKHSSLFHPSSSDEQNQFYNFNIVCQCYKTFFLVSAAAKEARVLFSVLV